MAEHTLHSIAFPVLNEDQIAQLANCTTVAPKHFRAPVEAAQLFPQLERLAELTGGLLMQ